MNQSAGQLLGIVLTWIMRVVVAGGGGAVVAYGIFRWLGKTWLDQHFSKQLEQFKHDRQTELEQFRHDMNALYSRISKIHEKEFEVLPRAWVLLHEAHGAVHEVVIPLKRYPDFNMLSELQFEAFLKDCVLADFQKKELRSADDRLKYYREARFWRELSKAKAAQTELNNYLALNSIFMTEALRRQFNEINSALLSSLIDEEYTHGQPYSVEIHKSIDAKMKRMSKCLPKLKGLYRAGSDTKRRKSSLTASIGTGERAACVCDQPCSRRLRTA
ncbi:MAG: hypothetical protein ACRD4H_08980 [Candidatus Acidiferrales bacterium]